MLDGRCVIPEPPSVTKTGEPTVRFIIEAATLWFSFTATEFIDPPSLGDMVSKFVRGVPGTTRDEAVSVFKIIHDLACAKCEDDSRKPFRMVSSTSSYNFSRATRCDILFWQLCIWRTSRFASLRAWSRLKRIDSSSLASRSFSLCTCVCKWGSDKDGI